MRQIDTVRLLELIAHYGYRCEMVGYHADGSPEQEQHRLAAEQTVDEIRGMLGVLVDAAPRRPLP